MSEREAFFKELMKGARIDGDLLEVDSEREATEKVSEEIYKDLVALCKKHKIEEMVFSCELTTERTIGFLGIEKITSLKQLARCKRMSKHMYEKCKERLDTCLDNIINESYEDTRKEVKKYFKKKEAEKAKKVKKEKAEKNF